MSALNNSLLLGAPAGGGYTVSRSIRLNKPDSAYFSRVPTSPPTSTQKLTYSTWIKRSSPGAGNNQGFGLSATGRDGMYIIDTDKIAVFFAEGVQGFVNTLAVLRDPSAWYHIVVAIDTTQAVEANRVKIYINNELQALTGTYPSSNYNFTNFNASGITQSIGYASAGTQYFDGYLAEIHCIDGQALDPTSFGEFDQNTGVWSPKKYSGSYGQNGFRLDFSDNSAATSTTLGKDSSPNGNHWQPNNFSVSGDIIYAPYSWSGIDGYIPGGYTRTSNPQDCLVDNNTGVIVNWGAGSDGYFAIKPTSSTVTIRWIVYDGSGGSVPAVTLHTTGAPSFPNPISFSSYTGNGSTSSNRVGTYSGLTVGTTYFLRCGMVGEGNPALVTYITNATIASIGTSPIAAAGIDSLVDSPTNGLASTGADPGGVTVGNYCTFNPLISTQPLALVNGNLETSSPGAAWRNAKGTFGMTSGKWYWEHTVPTTGASDGYIGGVATADADYSSSGTGIWGRQGTTKYSNGSSSSTFGSTTSGDILGFAFDADAGKLWVAQNGVWVGDPAAGTGESWSGIPSGVFPYVAAYNQVNIVNFGQRAFAYTNGRSSFRALCTANLPAPPLAKPSIAFNALTYSGTGAARTVSGLDFSSDLIWIKVRNAVGYSHVLMDTIRGTSNGGYTHLNSDTTGNEYTGSLLSTDSVTSISNTGFSLGSNAFGFASVNQSGNSYVAWCWAAGGSTVIDNTGSIQTTRRTNPANGFSIIAGTGNGSFGHGLGVAPAMYIIKDRANTGTGWWVNHSGLANQSDKYLGLHLPNGVQTTSWGGSPTSTIAYVSNAFVGSSNWICYAWAPVPGLSAFGSFVGNGLGGNSAPFVWTGFRPRWILIKNASASNQWAILDTARDAYNGMQERLHPNLGNPTNTGAGVVIDALSNGFKCRNGDSLENGSNNTIVWAAFAESPFAVNNRAR